MFTCEYCAATLPTQRAFDDHLNGWKHRKKMREQGKQWPKTGEIDEPKVSNRQTVIHEEE